MSNLRLSYSNFGQSSFVKVKNQPGSAVPRRSTAQRRKMKRISLTSKVESPTRLESRSGTQETQPNHNSSNPRIRALTQPSIRPTKQILEMLPENSRVSKLNKSKMLENLAKNIGKARGSLPTSVSHRFFKNYKHFVHFLETRDQPNKFCKLELSPRLFCGSKKSILAKNHVAAFFNFFVHFCGKNS